MCVKSKKILSAVMAVTWFMLTGCSDKPQEESDIVINEREVCIEEEGSHTEADNLDTISTICCDIYDEAIQTNTLGSLEMMRSIISRLGENGYTAVDSENQIDMTGSDKVIQFCKKVGIEEEAELTIIVVSYFDGFIKYDFKTEGGNVDIVREYYQYIDGRMEHRNTGTYRANIWQYTEEGYLLFEGHWFAEDYYMLTLNEVPERTALRVKSLDGKCRELNRQYILPIGYGRNNMFLVDWSEDDFGELNFYDMYDIFYPFIYGQSVPYVMDKNLEAGAVYRIPKEEFETVIMTYFNIDSETLQSKTAYFPEDTTYEYKPRGFYEFEYPEIPYPEVVNYVENNDGTMTLTVNVVFPGRIILSEDNYEQTWNAPRLTEEEWEKIYGDFE